MARIDDANRRILTKKFELGLFERPLADRSYTVHGGQRRPPGAGPPGGRKSQVVLKNAGNILPLARDDKRIFVAGKSADNIGNQSGGWTISWQGASGNITPGTTILQGIRNTVGAVQHGDLQRDRLRHQQHLQRRDRGRRRDAVRRGAGRPARRMGLDPPT